MVPLSMLVGLADLRLNFDRLADHHEERQGISNHLTLSLESNWSARRVSARNEDNVGALM